MSFVRSMVFPAVLAGSVWLTVAAFRGGHSAAVAVGGSVLLAGLTLLLLERWIPHRRDWVRGSGESRVDWHHSVEFEESITNFGSNIAVWDHVFGTFHHPGGAPERVGLDDLEVADSFLAQLPLTMDGTDT